MKVYIVSMFRFGHKQSHSYMLGAFEDMEVALVAASGEESERGHKYCAEVMEMKVNSLDSHITKAVIIREADSDYKAHTNAICERCGQIIDESKE